MGQGIAVFDFDGTLVAGDSLLPFVACVVGRGRMRSAFAGAVAAALAGRPHQTPDPDLRSRIKAGLLARTLAGVPVAQAAAAAQRMVPWLRWHEPMRCRLLEHAARGDRVVVATGALAVYMPCLLAGLPVDALLATELETVDGVLTGRIAGGPTGGNCVRAVKAARVGAYLADHGPFARSWGYGNRPSDLPFLALMDEATVVPTVRR